MVGVSREYYKDFAEIYGKIFLRELLTLYSPAVLTIFRSDGICDLQLNAVNSGSQGTTRFHVQDLHTGLAYLIGTGSDVFLLTADSATLNTSNPSHLSIYAANDTRV